MMIRRSFFFLLTLAFYCLPIVAGESSTEAAPPVEQRGRKSLAQMTDDVLKKQEPQPLAQPAKSALPKADAPKEETADKPLPVSPVQSKQIDLSKAAPEQKKTTKQEKASIELNFENASLQKFLDYIMGLFEVTFLFDDGIPGQQQAAQQPAFGMPAPAPTKALTDIKINFRSHHAMTEPEVWALVDLLLETAGYARVVQPNISPKVYRIIAIPQANKAVLPTYIGTRFEMLPSTGRIRYVYFAVNSSMDQLQKIISQLKSNNAQLQTFADARAIVLTDNAYNIKSLMRIINELDNGALPEVLSILKLQNSDAGDVVKLYEALRGKEDPFRREAKKTTSYYFSPDVKVIQEPRTNSLILLGPKDAVRRIEDFVATNLDTKLKKLPSPIHVYELEYAPAGQIADILNTVTAFGQDTDAGKYGGVRNGEKYFSKMLVTADTQGNRLLIRGSEEDYQLIKQTIKELDQRQPQVVVEVLITSLTLDKTKAINSALHNKVPGNVNFQTTGFAGQGALVNTTGNSGSLVTNLISLATSAVVGSTVFSLGKESVWALLSVLQQTTELNIVSNPFLVATNKYKANVALGSTRRVLTGNVVGGADASTSQVGSLSALLEVTITPQINRHGIINLDIDVKIEDFTNPQSSDVNDPNNANKTIKVIHTNANVANGEVLALGGLIKNTTRKAQSGVPILQDIPLIGYLFKNKSEEVVNDNLLIFMTPKIISPLQDHTSSYTQRKAQYARDTFTQIECKESQRDPIYQIWFKERYNTPEDQLNQMVPLLEPQVNTDCDCNIVNKLPLEPLRQKGRCSLIEAVKCNQEEAGGC